MGGGEADQEKEEKPVPVVITNPPSAIGAEYSSVIFIKMSKDNLPEAEREAAEQGVRS